MSRNRAAADDHTDPGWVDVFRSVLQAAGCHAHRVASKLLTAPEGEVVDEAADEPMVDIEVRQTVVALRIVIAQNPCQPLNPLAPIPAAADFESVLLA